MWQHRVSVNRRDFPRRSHLTSTSSAQDAFSVPLLCVDSGVSARNRVVLGSSTL